MPKAETATSFDLLPRKMDRRDFVEKFGGVYEHFPEIAERAFDRGLSEATDTPEGLATTLATVAAQLDAPAKLKLIRNHPDLAGRLGVADLTVASRAEQAGAGLSQCTPVEFQRFQEMNDSYKAKFAFPFIMAVAGKTRHDILVAFEKRIGNERDTEFRTALAEIDKIAQIRLKAMTR